MGSHDIEKQIAELDPEVSKIYFEAKNELIATQDSTSERFAHAARIVKTFWKRVRAGHHHQEK